MSGFEPAPYEPSSALEMLHSSPRVQGSNQLDYPDTSGGFTQDSPIAQYGIGVAAGPIAMIVCFFIWTCALCCVGCCKRKVSCGNKPAIIIFVGFMVLSCFGWFYSIGGNAQTRSGIDKVFELGDNLNALVDTLKDRVLDALDIASDLIDNINGARVVCNIDFSAFPPPLDTFNVSEQLPGINNVIADQVRPELDSIVDSFRSVTDAYNEATDSAEPFLNQWQEAYLVLVSLIIVLIIIFTLATVWRVWENAPGHGSKIASCLGKSGSWIFFSLGILLLLLVWIVIALLAAISTVGADICLPSPADNLIRIADQATQDSRSPGVGICDEIPYSYVCFYTKCEGTNPLEDINTEIEGLLDLGVVDEINIIIQNLTDALVVIPPGPTSNAVEECILTIDNAAGNVTTIPQTISDALDEVGCSAIQPIYAGLAEEGLCNGVAAGMAVTWITMALGAVSLMAALFTYRLFEFDKYQDGQLMVANVVDEDGGKYAP